MAKLILTFFDTSRGVAMPGIDVELQKIFDGSWKIQSQLHTDINGNVEVLPDDVEDDLSGYYEATARIGNYFLTAGYVLPTLKFIDVVPIRFGISDPEVDTHIQISVSPYGYSFQSI